MFSNLHIVTRKYKGVYGDYKRKISECTSESKRVGAKAVEKEGREAPGVGTHTQTDTYHI